MLLRNKLSFVCLVGVLTFSNAQDTLSSVYKYGFFDLTVGTDTRVNSLNEWNNFIIRNSQSGVKDTVQILSGDTKHSLYQGVFFRFQTSFLGTYRKHKFKRLSWGDLISVELSGGYSSSCAKAIGSELKAFYNCEFGAFGTYKISPSTDIGMSLAMLKFYRDYLSDFYSGSNYYIKFRHKRLIGEFGYESFNKLYFGVFNFIVKGANLDRISISFKYFIKPTKLIGIRYEAMPINIEYMNNSGKESVFSVKLFYGVNF